MGLFGRGKSESSEPTAQMSGGDRGQPKYAEGEQQSQWLPNWKVAAAEGQGEPSLVTGSTMLGGIIAPTKSQGGPLPNGARDHGAPGDPITDPQGKWGAYAEDADARDADASTDGGNTEDFQLSSFGSMLDDGADAAGPSAPARASVARSLSDQADPRAPLQRPGAREEAQQPGAITKTCVARSKAEPAFIQSLTMTGGQDSPAGAEHGEADKLLLPKAAVATDAYKVGAATGAEQEQQAFEQLKMRFAGEDPSVDELEALASMALAAARQKRISSASVSFSAPSAQQEDGSPMGDMSPASWMGMDMAGMSPTACPWMSDPYMAGAYGMSPYCMPPYGMACSPWGPQFPQGEPDDPKKVKRRQRAGSLPEGAGGYAAGGNPAEPLREKSKVPDDQKTTIMLRHLPNNYTHAMVVDLLNKRGLRGKYDFVYLPYDFNRGAGLGYAFINFVSNDWARRAMSEFANFNQWTMASKKVCAVNWGEPLQGQQAHIDRYKDSPVMHPQVPPAYKPVLYDENGDQVPFPKPAKPPRRPRWKNGSNVETAFPLPPDYRPVAAEAAAPLREAGLLAVAPPGLNPEAD